MPISRVPSSMSISFAPIFTDQKSNQNQAKPLDDSFPESKQINDGVRNTTINGNLDPIV